jgi:hypothetical protein
MMLAFSFSYPESYEPAFSALFWLIVGSAGNMEAAPYRTGRHRRLNLLPAQ